MPQLTVHTANPELVRRLELRAALHGHSAEVEHLNILQAALMDAASPRSFKEALLSRVGWANGFIVCPRGIRHNRWAGKKTPAHPTLL
jgi:plasmid stability protein